MKATDRQLLFDRLMQGASEQCASEDPQAAALALRLFEESTTEDLDALEPLIDKIIAREVAAVRRVA